MTSQSVTAPVNFDFLARSFALRAAQGEVVDIAAITGNMNALQKAWFLSRYEHYCRVMEHQEAEIGAEHRQSEKR